MDLEAIRREYLLNGLSHDMLDADPQKQFSLWMEQAIDSGIADPTAMTLATVSASGQPSQRIVLLKHTDSKGYVFFTNYTSAKAQDMAVQPKVSLHFPWHLLERQVLVSGHVEKVPHEETEAYFWSRPRESQIAAWASKQSQPVASRDELMERFNELSERFKDKPVPVPEFWGGYRVIPEKIEFWQGGANRLHDRFVYIKQVDGSWNIQRLAP